MTVARSPSAPIRNGFAQVRRASSRTYDTSDDRSRADKCSRYSEAVQPRRVTRSSHVATDTKVQIRSTAMLLVAGFSDRSNLAARCRNGGFPCRIWAPTVRRDKINRWNCLERNFVGVRVGCSQSAMSVLTQNVLGPIQPITEKVGHFSASCPNSRGQRNPQRVAFEPGHAGHERARRGR
jgi:hypothetical protein